MFVFERDSKLKANICSLFVELIGNFLIPQKFLCLNPQSFIYVLAKETKILINPRGVKIVANTVGFFIANDAEEVRRANAFCKVSDEWRNISKIK